MISYAQNFEDVLLNRYFEGKTTGFYIDVGAWEPTRDSVTRHFYDLGWNGINIEPGWECFQALVAERPKDICLNIALGDKVRKLPITIFENSSLSTLSMPISNRWKESKGSYVTRKVDIDTLENICRKHVSGPIDFLKIDVEGWEKQVIAGGDWRNFAPRVVLVEAIHPVTQEPNWEDWEPLLLSAGYRFVNFDGLNRFYLHRSEPIERNELLSRPPNVLDKFTPYAVASSRQLRDEARREADALKVVLDQQAIQLDIALCETSDLKEALAQAQEKVRESAAVERKITSLESENRKLTEKLNELDLQTEASELATRNLQDALRVLTEETTAKEEQLTAARSRLRALEQELNAVKSENLSAVSALNQKLLFLQDENEKKDRLFSENISKFDLQIKANDELGRSAQLLRAECEELIHSLDLKDSLLNEEKKNTAKIIAEKDEIISKLDSDINLCLEKLSRLENNSQNDRLKIGDLTDAIAVKEKEIEFLKESLLDGEKAISSLNTQNKSIAEECSRFKGALQEARTHLDEIVDDSALKDSEINHLRESVLDRDGIISKLDTDYKTLAEKASHLESALKDTRIQLDEMAGASIAKGREIEYLKESLLDRDNRILKADSNLVRQVAANKILRESEQSLRTQLATNAEVCAELRRSRERAEADLLHLQAKLSQQASQLEKRDREFATAHSDKQSLSRALEDATRSIELLNATQNNLTAKFASWRDTMLLLKQMSDPLNIVDRFSESIISSLVDSPLFDVDHYELQAGHRFNTKSDAVRDYLSHGWMSGFDPNPLFDTSWYIAQNPDVEISGINPLVHFVVRGMVLRRNPHPLFDVSWYLEQYADVEEVGINPLSHYLLAGASEGRRPNPLFDPEWYTRSYLHSVGSQGLAIDHYIRHSASGLYEPCPLFDSPFYLALNPDAAREGMTPLGHYLQVGAAKGASPCPYFDPRWYKATYEDIGKMDPFLHYAVWGQAEERNPNAYFDSVWYKKAYPDIEAAGIPSLSHFLEHGWKERRNPSPHFNTGWYLDAYPDIEQSGECPLTHFIKFGRSEGRFPTPTNSQSVHLDADYGVSEVEFQNWRASRAQKLRKARPLTTPLLLLISISSASELGDAQITLDSLQGTNIKAVVYSSELIPEDHRFSGADYIVGVDALAERLRECPEHGMVIQLFAGDRIDSLFVGMLASQLDENKKFVIFDMFYKVEDRVFPIFLPGINRTHFLNCDYIRSRFAVAAPLLAEYLASAPYIPYSFAKRKAVEIIEAGELEAIAHIQFPLVEIGDQTTSIHRERQACIAAPSQTFATSPTLRHGDEKVSVIICTKDKGHLMEQLLRSLTKFERRIFEIIIISNNTKNHFAKTTLEKWKTFPTVKVITFDNPYNFSKQCNLGAREASGDLLLFLNDDIVPIAETWLEDLIAPMRHPQVAATGPLLLYPNEQVQHCGMFLGYNNVAGHTLRNARLPDGDYCFMTSAPRNVTALTGAALLIRTQTFRDINGFDEQLATYLQDVDICLRLHHSGHELVLNPKSILLHMESVSVHEMITDTSVQSLRGHEYRYFAGRWECALGDDPFHNQCLSSSDESLRTLA